MGVLPGVVPEGEVLPDPLPLPLPLPLPEPEPEPLPVLEPPAWPGLKFSDAWAASAVKADMVLLPDAGLEYVSCCTIQVFCEIHLRVDGTDHTSLAMLALRTVEPDRLCVLDANGVGQYVGCGTEGSVGRHEAREEGIGLVGHDVLDRYAGLVEGRLDDRVVLHDSLADNWSRMNCLYIPLRGIGIGPCLQPALRRC
jgi:hypothetical protein